MTKLCRERLNDKVTHAKWKGMLRGVIGDQKNNKIKIEKKNRLRGATKFYQAYETNPNPNPYPNPNPNPNPNPYPYPNPNPNPNPDPNPNPNANSNPNPKC